VTSAAVRAIDEPSSGLRENSSIRSKKILVRRGRSAI